MCKAFSTDLKDMSTLTPKGGEFRPSTTEKTKPQGRNSKRTFSTLFQMRVCVTSSQQEYLGHSVAHLWV